jgi:hypothetical protein
MTQVLNVVVPAIKLDKITVTSLRQVSRGVCGRLGAMVQPIKRPIKRPNDLPEEDDVERMKQTRNRKWNPDAYDENDENEDDRWQQWVIAAFERAIQCRNQDYLAYMCNELMAVHIDINKYMVHVKNLCAAMEGTVNAVLGSCWMFQRAQLLMYTRDYLEGMQWVPEIRGGIRKGPITMDFTIAYGGFFDDMPLEVHYGLNSGLVQVSLETPHVALYVDVEEDEDAVKCTIRSYESCYGGAGKHVIFEAGQLQYWMKDEDGEWQSSGLSPEYIKRMTPLFAHFKTIDGYMGFVGNYEMDYKDCNEPIWSIAEKNGWKCPQRPCALNE